MDVENRADFHAKRWNLMVAGPYFPRWTREKAKLLASTNAQVSAILAFSLKRFRTPSSLSALVARPLPVGEHRCGTGRVVRRRSQAAGGSSRFVQTVRRGPPAQLSKLKTTPAARASGWSHLGSPVLKHRRYACQLLAFNTRMQSLDPVHAAFADRRDREASRQQLCCRAAFRRARS